MPPPHHPLSESHHPNNKICQQPPTPPSLPAPTVLLHPPPSLHPQNSRSEEHTSELQSLAYLVCRLLLEKKKKKTKETKLYKTSRTYHESYHIVPAAVAR